MDGSQFDDISRKLAHRSSRREAVRAGGIMAAVAGAFAARSVAGAQSDDEETTDCEWAFKALIIAGPNKDATYDGIMRVEIERDGAINRGTLEPEDGEPFDFVGNTRGKAISLVVKLSELLSLHLTGAGSRDIKSCQGQIAGTFAGPEFGDHGVWLITRRPRADDDDDFVAFPTPTSPGGGHPGPGKPSPTAGSNTTPCPPEDCGVTKMWDPQQCKCVCYDNGVDCGPTTCCPQGAVCESGGGCSCPPGTVLCGNACVSACPPGQMLDNNCACTGDCSPGQVKCNGQCVIQCTHPGETFNPATCQCENSCPPGNVCCPGLDVCIDVVNDTDNCGSCGNVCQPGMPCIAGTCTCPATMKYCASSDTCIDENAVCQ